MSKKIMHKKQQASVVRFIWLWVVVGALLLVVGGIMVWNGLGGQTTTPPQVTGAPRLAVDQTTIDEGDVKLGKSIRSAFRLQNVGDQSLQILGEPTVEVVEGCWPPKAVVGSTTLNPGAETMVMLDYMMHTGMDGPHQFRVHLRTNDPAEPEKLLVVKSNWVP